MGGMHTYLTDNSQHFIKNLLMKFGSFLNIISHLVKIIVIVPVLTATNYQNITPRNMKMDKQRHFTTLNQKYVKIALIMMNVVNRQMLE